MVPNMHMCECYLCSDVAVLMQSVESIDENLPPLLQHRHQLILELITHVYVLTVIDGLHELHRRFMSRRAWCVGSRREEKEGEREEQEGVRERRGRGREGEGKRKGMTRWKEG